MMPYLPYNMATPDVYYNQNCAYPPPDQSYQWGPNFGKLVLKLDVNIFLIIFRLNLFFWYFIISFSYRYYILDLNVFLSHACPLYVYCIIYKIVFYSPMRFSFEKENHE